MRKKNQEIRDEQILEEMLSQATICRVAMTDQEAPYLLAFNYGYRNRVIYIHSATAGKKIDLLRENPRVCFEIESKSELVKGGNACDWSTTYRSIVGYGNVEIVTDSAQKKEGLQIIMSQHGAPELNVFKEKNVDSVVILKLAIDSMTGKQSGNWDRVHKRSLIELETDRLESDHERVKPVYRTGRIYPLK